MHALSYQAGRMVDDAKTYIMNTVYRHLEHSNITDRLLTSLLRNSPPTSLHPKMTSFFCGSDFLTNRTQRVLVSNIFSDLSFTSTAPLKPASSHLCSSAPTPMTAGSHFMPFKLNREICVPLTFFVPLTQASTYGNYTDIQEYTETMLVYITKCIDDVTTTKTVTVQTNQNPWP